MASLGDTVNERDAELVKVKEALLAAETRAGKAEGALQANTSESVGVIRDLEAEVTASHLAIEHQAELAGALERKLDDLKPKLRTSELLVQRQQVTIDRLEFELGEERITVTALNQKLKLEKDRSGGLDSDLDLAVEELARKSRSLEDALGDAESLRSQMELQGQRIGENRQLFEEAQERVDELEPLVEEKTREIKRLRKDLATAGLETTKDTEYIEELEADLDSKTKLLTINTRELAEAKVQVEGLRTDVQDLSDRNKALQLRLDDSQSEVSRLTSALKVSEGTVADLQRDLSTSHAETDATRVELQEARNELERAVQLTMEKTKELVEAHNEELSGVQGKLEAAESLVLSLQEELALQGGSNDTISQQLLEAKKQVETLTASEKDLNGQVESLTAELATRKMRHDALKHTHQELEKELVALRSVKEEARVLREENDDLKKEVRGLRSERLEHTTGKRKAEDSVLRLTRELLETQEKLAKEKQAKVAAQREFTALESSVLDKDHEIETLTLERGEALKSLARVEAELASVRKALGVVEEKAGGIEKLEEHIEHLTEGIRQQAAQISTLQLVGQANQKERERLTEEGRALLENMEKMTAERNSAQEDLAEAKETIAQQQTALEAAKAEADIQRLRAEGLELDLTSRDAVIGTMQGDLDELRVKKSDIFTLPSHVSAAIIKKIAQVERLGTRDEKYTRMKHFESKLREHFDVDAIAKYGGSEASRVWSEVEAELKKLPRIPSRGSLIQKCYFKTTPDSDLKVDKEMFRLVFLNMMQKALESHAALASVQAMTPHDHFDTKIREQIEKRMQVSGHAIGNSERTYHKQLGAMGHRDYRIPSPGEKHVIALLNVALLTYRDSIQKTGRMPTAKMLREAFMEDHHLLHKLIKDRVETSRANQTTHFEEMCRLIENEGLGDDLITITEDEAKDLFNIDAASPSDIRVFSGTKTVKKTATVTKEVFKALDRVSGTRTARKATRLQIACAAIIKSLEETSQEALSNMDEAVKRLPTLQISKEMKEDLLALYPVGQRD